MLTQPLFEAICRMPALQGLYIKWGKLTDATALQQLRQLRFLHIGSAPRLQPLDVLAKLPELQWLELENVQAATDTAFLLPLKGLRGLSLQGPLNGGKPLALKSLQALTALQQLEWLDLGNLTLADQSLTVIAELPTLRHLHLCNRFAMEQLAALAGKRPDLDCPRLQPHSDPVEWTLCRYCGQPRMVMLTGKGKPWLCLDCDSQRLHQHCQQFAKLAQQAAGAAHNRCQDQSFPA